MAQDDPEIEAQRDEIRRRLRPWRDAIGDFMVAFGGCEFWTYQFIRAYGTDVERQTSEMQKLNQRSQLAERVLRRLFPERHQAIRETFGKLWRLAKARNLIAHNPPMTSIYVNDDLSEHLLVVEIRGPRGDPALATLEMVRRWAKDADELDRALMELGRPNAGDSAPSP